MELERLEQRVRDLLAREARVDPSEIDDATRLLSSGLVDSIAMVRVAGLIERELGIVIPDRDVNEDNFETLALIRAYVERRRAEA